MSEMYIGRVAYMSVDADLLAAARSLAWATGSDTVCLNVDTLLENLEPATAAAQRILRLAVQANELGAGDLILDEAQP